MPKALVVDDRGSWLLRSIDLLSGAGCAPVIVVLGARAEEARELVTANPRSGVDPWVHDAHVHIVVAADWELGMSASLRTGLTAAAETDAPAVVITLVDLPGLSPAAVTRLIGASPAAADLRQARYDGHPGHPVLVGRDHWADLAASATGDSGARGYLAAMGADQVDCTDLGGGGDVDGPSTSAS